MSRSRDALQRVGTSAPIYAALAERLSSMEGASHPGDGFSRRRGPGSAPRPATAAVRPPVAGPGLATSCSASSSSGSASRSHARAAALAAERAARAAVRERKELQQRQHFEDEQPLALQLRALQLRAFIAARQAAVRGSGGGGGAGSNGTGGGLSGSIGVAAEEALEKALEKERREAENVKAAITVKVKAVKDTMEKEQKAARAVKDMEKEQKGVMTSQVSRGRSRSAVMRPSVACSTAGSSHNGRDGGGGGGEGGGGGGGGSGGGGSGGDRVDTMLTMAHRVTSASPDGSGSGLRGGPIRTESLMDRLGAKAWLPVGAPSSSCLSGALSSSPGIRAALAAAMREPSSVAYSWRSSEADTEIHTEYTSGLFSQNPTDRFATGLGGPQPVARGAHGMGNVHAALTMRLKLPLVRRPSPPRAVGAGAPAVGTRGWFDPPDDADLLRRPEPHLLRRASLDENYERHGEGDLSREQRGAIADFMPEEQQALDAGDLFAAYDELDAIYQATPVGTQRAQLRAPLPKGPCKGISKGTKPEGGEPAQLAQPPGTYSPPLRALLDQLGAHPSREGEGEAPDERHHRATEAIVAAAIGIGKDDGSLPIRRREVGRSLGLGLGAPGPSHRSAASSRSRGRKAAKAGVGRKATKIGGVGL